MSLFRRPHELWMLIAMGWGAYPLQAETPPAAVNEVAAVVPSSAAFQEVCQKLRDVTLVEAEFSEEKTLHILSHPLHSSGTLLFSPQRGVYRVMKEPVVQEMLITRSQLIQKNAEGAVEHMKVAHQPVARAFIDIFLSFFSDERNTWDKMFDVTFSGTVPDWRIIFVAKHESTVAQAIHDMTLEGHDGVLSAMTLTESNGDQTRTTYLHPVIYRGAKGEKAPAAFPSDLLPGNHS